LVYITAGVKIGKDIVREDAKVVSLFCRALGPPFSNGIHNRHKGQLFDNIFEPIRLFASASIMAGPCRDNEYGQGLANILRLGRIAIIVLKDDLAITIPSYHGVRRKDELCFNYEWNSSIHSRFKVFLRASNII
jgi:hypothetical protein